MFESLSTQYFPSLGTQSLHITLLDNLTFPQLFYLLVKITVVTHCGFVNLK